MIKQPYAILLVANEFKVYPRKKMIKKREKSLSKKKKIKRREREIKMSKNNEKNIPFIS